MNSGGHTRQSAPVHGTSHVHEHFPSSTLSPVARLLQSSAFVHRTHSFPFFRNSADSRHVAQLVASSYPFTHLSHFPVSAFTTNGSAHSHAHLFPSTATDE